MASAEGGAVASASDRSETLKCALCLDIFKSPKLLPCFHTFCEQCLKDLVTRSLGQTFCCPSCRRETPVPDGGVRAFQTNFYILPEDLERARKSVVCRTHPRQELDWFCVDCNEVLCVKCAISKHKTHETQDLSVRAEKAKIELTQNAARLETCLSDLRRSLKSHTDDQQEARTKQDELVNLIRSKQTAIKAVVDKLSDEAVKSLTSITDVLWDKEVSSLREAETKLKEQQQKVEDVLNSGTACRLVETVKYMREVLTKLDKSDFTTGSAKIMRRPLLHSCTESEASTFLNMMRAYIGTASSVQLDSTPPDVIVKEQFRCKHKSDLVIFCVSPLDNGDVNVSYEPNEMTKNPPSERYSETGVLKCTLSATGKVTLTGRANEYGLVKHNSSTLNNNEVFHTYSKSPVVYRLSYESQGLSDVWRFQTVQSVKVFTIHCNRQRAFDVNNEENLFGVIAEAEPPTVYRTLRLFCYRKPDPVDTYSPPIAPFQPSDVCFFTLGGQEVLLVADELNDAIHVVNVHNKNLIFSRYLASGCPLLVQPTALNTDSRGRLWVACRSGRVLTCTPVSSVIR